MKRVAIIGNGISGITAARHIRKLSDYDITVVSSESEHFYSRTALMYIYMGHMAYENTKPYEDSFWKKNRIRLKKAHVETIDFQAKDLIFFGGEKLNYDILILAVGSKSNKFGWPGQDLLGVQGLYNLQDLEELEKNTPGTNSAVIIGGGLIGIELAEMLITRGIKITFLVRESEFWRNVLPEEEAKLVSRHVREHHVDLRLETELKEILPDEHGRAKAVITNKGDEIPCQIVGLTAGVSPNIDFLKDTELEVQRGIMVNEFLETNVPDVYAIGDCAQRHVPVPGRRPIEPIWYTGRMMGETVAKTICGNKSEYLPGVWFNSAKFFDIEYQTYGWVMAELREGEQKFYWEAQDGKKCIKMVFHEADRHILGVNVFGIRQRHEIWDKWIKEKKSIEYVLEHLPQANFDPEFFKQYEKEIIQKYNQENNANLKIKTKKGILAGLFA